MKKLAIALMLLIVGASLLADYLWKRWIEKQRRNRLSSSNPTRDIKVGKRKY